MNNFIETENDKWKKIQINIAIIGNSGVGKSAFIDAIRNISKNDTEYAEVGVTEATREPTPYKHPDHPNIVFWDLPGVSTTLFLKADYLEKVRFDQYDFFLILSAHRFTENDTWLAQEIRTRKLPYFFVHTQTDIDMGKEDDTGACIVVEKVRNDCIMGLDDENFTIPVELLFMINSKETNAFDFNRLTTALVESFPEKKREALALSMTILTKGVILEKREALRGKIHLTAIALAVTAAIQIPGLGAAVDTDMLARQVDEYRSQFGLDDISLRKVAQNLNTSIGELKTKLDLTSAAFGVINSVGKVPYLLLPFIGCAITADISYYTCNDILNKMLDEIANDSLNFSLELFRVKEETIKRNAKL